MDLMALKNLQLCRKKTTGLPTAHSCCNRLDLPSFADKEKFRKDLLYAITETHGFGLE